MLGAVRRRWAGEPGVGRVELWTGDGDFLPVRACAGRPGRMTVAFRSFPVGTAAEMQRLGTDWMPIGPGYLLA